MGRKLPTHPPAIRVGIDIGGTFTDFVVYNPADGGLKSFKLLSTPQDPAAAVLSGLALIQAEWAQRDGQPALDVIHGSTVATNALLERKGARTALVATQGFSDLLQIGRQNRPALYDFFANPPPLLVPAGLRFEVIERTDANGVVIQPLDPGQLANLVASLRACRAESVAICLLFSFLFPDHERLVASALREAGFQVSVSSEILPEFREFERASTTAANAYVSPVLDRYLENLQHSLNQPGASVALRVMQSNGGNMSLAEARSHGVRCILSGPAGGVVGAQFLTGLLEEQTGGPVRLITFDMGGTSTDVSLVAGQPQVTTESLVSGCPIRIPMLDIHTIGAGGGSIARLDPGGALRVGPESAGADPGPACYGRGELPTVTDANLVLGRLAADLFLGGAMRLDVERARQAIETLGQAAGLDLLQAALGVVQVANAHMERALRVISVERGHDSRQFTLLSFGGAGGLHAAELARRLGIGRVLIPPLASTLSAFGMLAADIIRDYTKTVMLPSATPLDRIAAGLEILVGQAGEDMRTYADDRVDRVQHRVEFERMLDLRYVGQSYELSVPFSEHFLADFHRIHQATYGYAHPGAELELVNLRLRAVLRVQPPCLVAQPLSGSDPAGALIDNRLCLVGETPELRPVPLYRAEALLPGNQLSGPALICRSDTTILLGETDSGHVDGYGNLWIKVGA
ncbi:MAG: hydantoinase/oxoprolinase family protein [Anaerolineales bacterium]|nr:hydantoinase/oxoprolinase family protein [Anaerolineales bacterium]